MADPLFPLVGADELVPVVGGRRVRHVNLDGAASAPALTAVAERVTTVLPWYASVHRGAGYASQVSTALYEQARRDVGAYVGARPDDLTVFTRNTTDALNLLAGTVSGRVLVLDLEHHANLLPWRRARGGVEVVATQPTVGATLDTLADALSTGRFSLLAVTGASNVTGESLPLGQVVDLAHRHGARIVVDGAQLLAHRRIDLAVSGVDYVVFSGHKLYAPFGAGALVGRADWLDAGEPHLAGGGAVRRVSVDDVEWTEGPARHEAGTPNLLGAVALATAARTLASQPESVVAAHESALRTRLVDGLEALEGVEVVRIWADSAEPIGVVTFRVADVDPGLLAAFLAAEHGVSVRDGRFCAHPLLDRLGWGDGAVRASLGVGSRDDDVDRLLAGIGAWLAGDRRATYESGDGVWVVVGDDRPTPAGIDVDRLAGTASPCTPALV